MHPDEWFALLRIGARLTLDEVLALDVETLQAMYRAATRLDTERAVQIAALVRGGEDAYPSVARETDGGEAHEAQLIGAALEMARESMGKVIEV